MDVEYSDHQKNIVSLDNARFWLVKIILDSKSDLKEVSEVTSGVQCIGHYKWPQRGPWGHQWCSICIGHYKWPQRSHRGRECTLQLTSKRLGHELCPIYIGHYKWPQLGHWGHEWYPISIGPKWWLNFFRFWTFGQKTTFGTVWESRSLQWKLDIPEFAMGNRTRPSFFSNSLFILAWKFRFLRFLKNLGAKIQMMFLMIDLLKFPKNFTFDSMVPMHLHLEKKTGLAATARAKRRKRKVICSLIDGVISGSVSAAHIVTWLLLKYCITCYIS